MPIENQPGPGAGEAPSSPSVAEFVGGMFGDTVPFSEPEPAATAPASPETPATESEASSEAAPSAAGEDAQPSAPADQEGQEGGAPTSDEQPEYQPFSYTVNGEERAVEGIKVIPDLGAVVDLEYVPTLQQQLAAAEFASRELDAINRFTEWRTVGQDGRETVLTGRDGLLAQKLGAASLGAHIKATENLTQRMAERMQFYDPAVFVSVLPDGRATWNQQAIQELRTQIETEVRRETELLTREAHFNVRAGFQQQATQPTASNAAPITAMGATQHVVEAARITGLTPQDMEWASQFAGKFYHPVATREDVQRIPGLVLGQPWIEDGFKTLLQDRAARNASASKAVEAATQVSRENAAKLQAAAQGRKGPTAPATKQPAQRAPQYRAEDDAVTAFAARENAMARALRAHA